MIIYKDEQLKKNLSCLCLEDGDPEVTGKVLYFGYTEPKLKIFFDGHNKVCRKLKSQINRVEFLSPAEYGACPIGWVYKFENNQWYIAETVNGEYKLLESFFEEEEKEAGVIEITKYMRTNYLSAKEQVKKLKEAPDGPLLDTDNMAEVDVDVPEDIWKTLETLSEEFECSAEELVRYLLLSYVSDLYIGEEKENGFKIPKQKEDMDAE